MSRVGASTTKTEEGGQAISMQPTSITVATPVAPIVQSMFMAAPASIPGVPPGLEYLTLINQLRIRQAIELLEVFLAWESQNKYEIKNSLNQPVYVATEESECCMRQCCGPARGFHMHINDYFGREVIRVVRDFKCCAGCNCCADMACCSMDIRIEAPVGQVIGYMRQTKSCWRTRYVVEDAFRNPVFTIVGPCCTIQGICCRSDVEFKIMSADGVSQLGVVSKQWAGFCRELLSDADNLSVSFPVDLDVKMKATLLGAVFLIDFMHFEYQH